MVELVSLTWALLFRARQAVILSSSLTPRRLVTLIAPLIDCLRTASSLPFFPCASSTRSLAALGFLLVLICNSPLLLAFCSLARCHRELAFWLSLTTTPPTITSGPSLRTLHDLTHSFRGSLRPWSLRLPDRPHDPSCPHGLIAWSSFFTRLILYIPIPASNPHLRFRAHMSSWYWQIASLPRLLVLTDIATTATSRRHRPHSLFNVSSHVALVSPFLAIAPAPLTATLPPSST